MSLFKKTFLTAFSKILNLVSHFIFQFFMMPIILAFLGKELFGVYTIITKLEGYVSLTDLRPTAILRYKLASLQASTNQKLKNEYVTSSLIISCFLLPFIFLVGYFLSIGFDLFFEIDEKNIKIAKNSILILSAFIGIKSFFSVPEAIIRGNNAEYKLFFAEPLKLLLYSFIVYLLLKNGYGIYGIIFSILSVGVIDFLLKFLVQKATFINYKIVKPTKQRINEFLSKGSWYLASSLGYQIISTLDVIIIGINIGVKEVTIYAISKAMIFRFSESFSIISSSISSSFGYLINIKDFSKLIFFRYLLFKIGLVFSILIIGYFFVFNSYFISLWVGPSNYIGEIENLIICITVVFIVWSMNTSIFIDAFQIFKIKGKVLLCSSIIFIFLTHFLSIKYNLLGVVLSVLILRFLIFCLYEIILQKYLRINFLTLLKNNYKTFFLFVIIFLYKFIYFHNVLIPSWISFLLHSFLYFIIYLFFSYFILEDERKYILNIIKNSSEK